MLKTVAHTVMAPISHAMAWERNAPSIMPDSWFFVVGSEGVRGLGFSLSGLPVR